MHAAHACVGPHRKSTRAPVQPAQPKTLAGSATKKDTVTKSQRKAIHKAISRSDAVALRDAAKGLPEESPEEYGVAAWGRRFNTHSRSRIDCPLAGCRLRTERFDFARGRRMDCIFYRDGGGFQATDEHDLALPEVYHMGVIDILTPYDLKKKIEHEFKSMTHDKVCLLGTVSPVNVVRRRTRLCRGR